MYTSIKYLAHSSGYTLSNTYHCLFVIADISNQEVLHPEESTKLINTLGEVSWVLPMIKHVPVVTFPAKLAFPLHSLPFQNQFRSTDLDSNQNLFMRNSWMNHWQSSLEKGAVDFTKM